ncbi:MAG: hypothetical protein WBJ81_06115 [Rickettsiales bacterium]
MVDKVFNRHSITWPTSSPLNEGMLDIPEDVCTFYRNPEQLPINTKPIEKNTHHFWLKTHNQTDNSKEIPDVAFDNLLNQYSRMDNNIECFNIKYYLENKQNWQCITPNHYMSLNQNEKSNYFHHFFWVNDETLYPTTIAKLKAINVDIKNINSLDIKAQHLDKINDYIDKGYYGSMVDTLKYKTALIYGGVATDLNFELYTKKLGKFFDDYSFITVARNFRDIENYFIAAHKDHSILNAMSDVIDNMLDNSEIKDDLHLTHITYGVWRDTLKSNIENAEGVNEIFKFCYGEMREELYIGRDPDSQSSWFS